MPAPTFYPSQSTAAQDQLPVKWLSWSQNPLVVQFWLWGIDAARGDLRQHARFKSPCSRGSSVYHCHGFLLHSMGMVVQLTDTALYYDRPRGLFYPCSAEQGFESLPQGQPLPRMEGLLLVQDKILAYEQWLQQKHGPTDRALLLSRALPGKVRREVQAWKTWIQHSPSPTVLPPMHFRAVQHGLQKVP